MVGFLETAETSVQGLYPSELPAYEAHAYARGGPWEETNTHPVWDSIALTQPTYEDAALTIGLEESMEPSAPVNVEKDNVLVTGTPQLSGIKTLIWGCFTLITAILLLASANSGNDPTTTAGSRRPEAAPNDPIERLEAALVFFAASATLLLSGLLELVQSLLRISKGGKSKSNAPQVGGACIILACLILSLIPGRVADPPGTAQLVMTGFMMAGMGLFLATVAQRIEYDIKKSHVLDAFYGSPAPPPGGDSAADASLAEQIHSVPRGM